MNIQVAVYNNLDDIKYSSYYKFYKNIKASIFYSWEFLLAVEKFPLLPTVKVFYIVASSGDELVGFLPLYLQKNVDPFNVLSQNTGYLFTKDTSGLFSHIMHVSDSKILVLDTPSNLIVDKILGCVKDIQLDEKIDCCGILNIDTNCLNYTTDIFQKHDFKINLMWNRYKTNVFKYRELSEIIQNLPSNGRREVNRQIRKYNLTESSVEWKNIKDMDLNVVVNLIYDTTNKYGTAAYYPKDAMYNFLTNCDKIAKIIEIKCSNHVVGVGVVFLDNDTLHLWAVGINYKISDYSPYTILYVNLYKYAISNNYKTIEVGRTTQSIKERLGFSAVPLQSIINFS
ncbi:MAG TPA: GNAT family N-acetyltransferase [Burkholderiales bacterium]|nr:GNAT family N-acetyltransferase [Burkholderiales bacterium]